MKKLILALLLCLTCMIPSYAEKNSDWAWLGSTDEYSIYLNTRDKDAGECQDPFTHKNIRYADVWLKFVRTDKSSLVVKWRIYSDRKMCGLVAVVYDSNGNVVSSRPEPTYPEMVRETIIPETNPDVLYKAIFESEYDEK